MKAKNHRETNTRLKWLPLLFVLLLPAVGHAQLDPSPGQERAEDPLSARDEHAPRGMVDSRPGSHQQSVDQDEKNKEARDPPTRKHHFADHDGAKPIAPRSASTIAQGG